MSVLALDAGTTGVTALVVSSDAQIVARGYAEFLVEGLLVSPAPVSSVARRATRVGRR